MKNALCVIILTFLSYIGIKTVDSSSILEEDVKTCILQDNVSFDNVCFIPSQSPEADNFCIDAESLAGQLRVVGRWQRQLSVAYSFLAKGDVCRMVKSCLDALLQSANHVYTSLPRPCWSVSSEHYIFGMRRILI